MLTRERIDEYIESNGKIRVAIAGAGYMTKGFLNQIKLADNVQVVALASKTYTKAIELVDHVGLEGVEVIESIYDLVNYDVSVIMDLMGDVEAGAKLAKLAIEAGIHIMTSAETDATVGPVLNEMATKAGVVYSNMYGDEPALTKSLYDYADVLGFEIIAIGKFKGFIDSYANPDSVKPWADEYGQNPIVISTFADGSKLSMEMTVVANATGFVPDVRGMHKPKGSLEEVTDLLKLESEGGVLSKKGCIEIIRGAEPSGAVFAVIRSENPDIMDSLKYYKRGDGPNYLMYRPYHMPGIEMLYGVYNMVIYNKTAIKPLGSPVCDVVTIAKRDLSPGDVLGEIGEFDYFGEVEVARTAFDQNALPLGLAKHAKVTKSISKGSIVTKDAVIVEEHDVTVKLRVRYDEMIK